MPRRPTRPIRPPMGVARQMLARDRRKRAGLAKFIRRVVDKDSEKMRIDYSALAATVTTAGHVVSVSGTAEGDGNEDRNGDMIKAKSLHFQYVLIKNGVPNQSQCRVCVVQDKQQISDSTISVTDIFEGNESLRMRNRSTMGRYRILYNKLHNLTSISEPSLTREVRIKLNTKIRYNGPLATDLQKNGIFLVLFSNEATNAVLFDWRTRLTFVDQ